MRRFLAKLLIFAALQAAIIGLLISRYDATGETDYFAATVDKHHRLEEIRHPCLVLAGGSGVAFGFQSEALERAAGRPVVNMGLAAGLGAEFMLAEIEPYLREGDSVVLSLEYDHFARGAATGRDLGFDPSVLSQVLIVRPNSVLALGVPHFRKVLLDRGLALLGEIMRRSVGLGAACAPASAEETRSARAAFNAWGDFVGHRNEPPRTSAETVDAAPLVAYRTGFPNAALLRRMSGFVDRAGRRGVRVAFTFPPRSIGTLRRDLYLARRLEAALREIHGLIVLDAPEDHAYPPGQFFDTANHLTAEGAAARTERLIGALEPLLGPER